MTAPLPFLIAEPSETYHARSREHLTSHQLADFRRCPELYRRKKLGLIPDVDRPAYLVGRAAHAWILEGREAFDQRYVAGGPINPRTGKPFGTNTQAYAEWAAEQALHGRSALSDDNFALVAQLAGGVRSHRIASELLSHGVAEAVVRTLYGVAPAQARIDWFHAERGIVDLKTCDDLTWFEADARRYGYAHQLAFYRAVVERASGVAWPVHLVAVEKKEPYRCGVWVLSDQLLAHCQRENEAAIARLAECAASDVWPTGYEELRVFDAA